MLQAILSRNKNEKNKKDKFHFKKKQNDELLKRVENLESPEINYDFSGVDAAKNEKDLYGLRYAEFVVPLVKAIETYRKT
jgi:hypothetical protein